MLRRIVAQQARSAREGMEWIGRLVERFGYVDTGRTYVVADPTEAWVVEVVRGPRWVAQRVPDDAVVVLPARHVIGEIDLGVPARFRAAPDLIPYAVRRGWYDPGAGRPFNFRLAYQTPEHVAPEGRQFRGQAIVSGKPGRWPTSDPLPFAVHPHKRLSAADVAAILRDDRGVARFYNESTQEAAVFQLRPGLPRPIGCVYWRTTGRPDVSVLTPWHAGITETPAIYGPRDAPARLLSITRHFEPSPSVFQPDPTLAWWKFKRLTEVVDRSYAERIGPVRTRWAEMERRLWREVSEVEARALALWSADQDGARALLTRFCREQALAACAEAERFARVLAAPAGS